MGSEHFNFFGEASPYLSHPLLTSERTCSEIDLVLELVPDPEHVIDVGCGFGRHVLELARRGIGAVGIDPSPQMCASARQRLAEANLSADIHQNTLAEFAPVARDSNSGPFDLALALFTTFGQLPASSSPADDAGSIAQLLRPGGRVIIEVPERDRALHALVETEQLGPTAVTRSYDEATRTLHEQFVGPAGTHNLGYRLFDRDELTQLLAAAGLTVTAVRDTGLATPPMTFMTVIAERSATL